MSQPSKELKAKLVCTYCGSHNPLDASKCWLCQGTDLREPSAPEGWQPVHDSPRFFSTIAGWMILIAGIAVFLGMLAVAPGLLILLAVTVFPTLIVAQVIARRKRRKGRPMTGVDWALLVLVLLFVVPIVLAAALFLALWIICMVNSPSFH